MSHRPAPPPPGRPGAPHPGRPASGPPGRPGAPPPGRRLSQGPPPPARPGHGPPPPGRPAQGPPPVRRASPGSGPPGRPGAPPPGRPHSPHRAGGPPPSPPRSHRPAPVSPHVGRRGGGGGGGGGAPPHRPAPSSHNAESRSPHDGAAPDAPAPVPLDDRTEALRLIRQLAHEMQGPKAGWLRNQLKREGRWRDPVNDLLALETHLMRGRQMDAPTASKREYTPQQRMRGAMNTLGVRGFGSKVKSKAKSAQKSMQGGSKRSQDGQDPEVDDGSIHEDHVADGWKDGQWADESSAIPLGPILADVAEQWNRPAVAAAVITIDGVSHVGVHGVRKAGTNTGVELSDRWHIGSSAKPMTATLAAMLVDAGWLQWETTLMESFPDEVNSIHPAYHYVTLEMLIGHRSGMPEDKTLAPAFLKAIEGIRGPNPTAKRKALMLMAMRAPPISEPNSTFAYCHAGYVVAGLMLETYTGQSFEDLMLQYLFRPLGMRCTGWGAPGRNGPIMHPWGHKAPPGTPPGVRPKALMGIPPGVRADYPSVMAPAGTLHCSLSDLGRFLALHLRGGVGQHVLLSPESFQRMQSDQYGDQFGLGWVVVQRPWANGAALHAQGNNRFWQTTMWVAPAAGVAYVVCTNSGDEGAFPACDAIVNRLIQGNR